MTFLFYFATKVITDFFSLITNLFSLKKRTAENDVEGMLKACFRTPKNQEEGRWMTIAEIFKVLQEQYPMLIADHRTKIRIGQAMKFLNCERKRTNKGPAYYLCSKMAKTC